MSLRCADSTHTKNYITSTKIKYIKTKNKKPRLDRLVTLRTIEKLLCCDANIFQNPTPDARRSFWQKLPAVQKYSTNLMLFLESKYFERLTLIGL